MSRKYQTVRSGAGKGGIREMEIKEIRERLIYANASVMTEEEFSKAKKILDEMSDSEILNIASKAIQSVNGKGNTKEYLNMAKKLQKIRGINKGNSALNSFKVNTLSEMENTDLLNKIEKSYLSDAIYLTNSEDIQLIDLWEKGDKSGITIPSDLFFANTVPLMDCKISVDEREIGGVNCSYRVIIFEDYAEKIKSADMDDVIMVGAAIIPIMGSGDIIIPINVVNGVDSIPICPIGFRNMPKSHQQRIVQSMSQTQLAQMLVSVMETWYGIQIALLHPEVKEVFKNPQTVRDYDSTKNNSKNNKKKRVRYIKKHVINKDELEKRIYGMTRTIKRHALLWYVIGHWRTYKDGRKVFIQPYWKGALRNEKNVVEAREREIIIKNEAVEA